MLFVSSEDAERERESAQLIPNPWLLLLLLRIASADFRIEELNECIYACAEKKAARDNSGGIHAEWSRHALSRALLVAMVAMPCDGATRAWDWEERGTRYTCRFFASGGRGGHLHDIVRTAIISNASSGSPTEGSGRLVTIYHLGSV